MKTAFAALFGLLALTSCAAQQSQPRTFDLALTNGLWFDGERFNAQTVYVTDGALHFSDAPLSAEKTMDLNGGYVVPPYCEAHNHNLGGGAEDVRETIDQYIEDGVFYAMFPGSFKFYRDKIASELNTPPTIDAAFANNGLTGSGGHPRGLRESLMERYGLYPDFTKETLPDTGYFEADTLAELHEKWALILAEKPDFIKVMLLHSEEYDTRKDNPEYYGRRGLDPSLMPALSKLAREENLRVAAHVETDADMATALRAGVDMIAHLVSHDADARLSDETISLAKAKGATVITTASIAKRFEQRTPEKYAAVIEAQKDNLRRLHEAGVILAVGSDNTRDTSRGEVAHLRSLSVFDNQSLLNMWTENCAATVFPDRAIGKLADGYEASFLVLEGDPLNNFDNVDTIRLRVKNGVLLD